MCKKIFTLLSFFVCFSSNIAFTQEIKWLDFERLIKKHPMMKNFDPSTNRFKNTSSEIIKIEDLKSQLASVSSILSASKKIRNETIEKTLTTDFAGNEEETWNSLKAIEEKISALSIQEEDLKKSITKGGFTVVTSILPIIRTMLRDQFKPFEANDSKVIINKLPRFGSQPIKINKNPLHSMMLNSNISDSDLKQYLSHSHSISLMFSFTDIPVLFPGDSK